MLCTGLVLANDPVKANATKPTTGAYNATGVQQSTGAHQLPGVQQNSASLTGPVTPKAQGNLATSPKTPKLAQPTKVPAGVHVRPLGASRACVNYIWDNVPNTAYYWGGNTILPIGSQVGVPLSGSTLVSCFYIEVVVTDTDPSTLPVTITVELAPSETAAAYPGTTQSVTLDATGGYGLTFDLATPVDISADVAKGYVIVRQTWLDSSGLTAYGGPLMGEYAELGSNPPGDWFYWNGGYYYFGGNPKSWFSASLFGPEETPFSGACCIEGTCFETDDYYTCVYNNAGKWFAFESCPAFAGCPHFGACCLGGVCLGNMYEETCTAQGGVWFIDEDCYAGYVCPPPPPNDNCADTSIIPIAADSSYTWTGDSTYATPECSLLGWPAEVWVGFSITEPLNVSVDLCGTTPAFNTIGIVLVQGCPCATTKSYSAYDFSTCGDGNGTIYFNSVPPGDWYYPIYTAPGSVGPYTLTVKTTIPPPPPPNDNCGDVVPFDLAVGSPVTITGDNTGATSDCAALGWPGEAWFAFTTTETLDITVDLCGTTPAFGQAGIVLVPDCPCSTYLFYGVSYSFSCYDGNITMTFYNVPAGTSYYPMYSQQGIALGPYTINFSAALPCSLECPPVNTPEAEICGDLYPNGTNGGCNSTPAAFEAIECGETKCGTIWADNSYRDTDWYQITTTSYQKLTWSGAAEMPFLMFIIDGSLGCPGSTLASATAASCQTATCVSDCLPPGTYWLWAGPQVWGEWPCPIDYYATLTCETCVPCQVDCPPDSAQEQEICGDLYPNGTNGGCNSTPAAFEAIECGETLCGTIWADNSYRDTDWYAVTTTGWKKFTWTVTAEMPLLIFVIDGTAGCPGITVASMTAAKCLPATITTASLPAGTYWFWVGGSTWGNYPCSQDYVATLTCEDSGPEYCTAGASYCDEFISQVDLGTFSNPTGCGLGSNGTPGYSDYTGMAINLNVGDSYTLTVTNGNLNYSADTCGAWIDFNDNYILTDAGEVLDMQPSPSIGPYSATFTVPNNPGAHRLRIRIDYAEPAQPCGIPTFGEVEDYTVTVGGGLLLGDMDCDGFVNPFDIDPFVQCLIYGTPTAPCTTCDMGDVDNDGLMNVFDIDPFVQCVIHNGCP